MSEALEIRRMQGADLTPDEADDLFAPEFTQSTHGFVVGDVVRRSSATAFTKAQADAIANVQLGLAIVVDQPDVNTFSYWGAKPHAITITTHGLGTFGQKLWLSQGSAGVITATEPTSGVVLYLGFVLDANTIYWEPGTPMEIL